MRLPNEESFGTLPPRAFEGPPWRILFMGTDDFSLKHLERLCSKYNTGTLISDLAVCTSRGSLIERLAKFENLTFYKWPLKVEDIENKFDIGIVVSFGHLIPKTIIDAIPLGILNVHASLLPRWRGAAPIHHAIMHGDNETGVTVMRINPYRFDTGSIVRQYKCSIGKNETTPELRTRLAEHGAELLIDCIRDLTNSLQNARPQTEEGATYAPRVTSETAQINWETMTAKDICNLQRAVSYLYPVHTRFKEHVVRLYSVSISRGETITPRITRTNRTSQFVNTVHEPKSTNELFMDSEDNTRPTVIKRQLPTTGTTVLPRPKSPGRITYIRNIRCLFVTCTGGQSIHVQYLSVAGKKQSTPADFYNGYLSNTPNLLWFFY